MTAPAPTLWRHRAFLRLWAAQAVSGFGARIAREGLPMTAAPLLQAPPAAMGRSLPSAWAPMRWTC
jgi:hypothetical protein